MSEQSFYKLRKDEFMQRLHDKNNACILVSSPIAIGYLTGFAGDDSLLLVDKEKFFLLTDRRFEEEAQDVYNAGNADMLIINNSRKEELDFIKGRLRDAALGDRLVGMEETDMSLFMFKQLAEGNSLNTFDVSSIISEMRQVKDEHEQSLVRKAGIIAVNAFQKLLEIISEGMTEKEVAHFLDWEMIKNGATAPSFPTIAAAGSNASRPHAVPSDKRIVRGDMVLLDFGAIYEGYCSDITRTIFCGTPDKQFIERYEAVLAAQETAISTIANETRCSQAYAAAREVLAGKGMAEMFTHGLGHGVGREIHEMPSLSPNADNAAILRSGMVVTVEPGVYYPGWGGIRIEDTVIVKNDSCEIVTLTSKQLLVFN